MKTIFFFLIFASLIIPQSVWNTDRDTLTAGTDSISTYDSNQPRQFKTIEITIRDTTGGIVDSFYLERYEVYDDTWYRIGARNTLTWETDQILVPGDGTIKNWLIYDFDEYPYYVRARRINAAYVSGVVSTITWTGKNNE